MPEADTQVGYYYVSVVDGSRHQLLAGPFRNDHAGALAMVEQARRHAYALDARACWYAYGTCRLPIETAEPPRGLLNAECGLD